jgi:hypothetical protein
MRYVSALLLAAASGRIVLAVCPTPPVRPPSTRPNASPPSKSRPRPWPTSTEAGIPTSRRNWSGAFQQGFAFIGTAYLQGVRDAEADRLLKAAEAAQKEIPVDELTARQAACRSEGARLLENANAIERASS